MPSYPGFSSRLGGYNSQKKREKGLSVLDLLVGALRAHPARRRDIPGFTFPEPLAYHAQEFANMATRVHINFEGGVRSVLCYPGMAVEELKVIFAPWFTPAAEMRVVDICLARSLPQVRALQLNVAAPCAAHLSRHPQMPHLHRPSWERRLVCPKARSSGFVTRERTCTTP